MKKLRIWLLSLFLACTAAWATVESGTYISDLNATYPAAGDSLTEGDDHLRWLKSAIKATFPNVSGAVTPTHTELNYVDGVTSAIQTQLDAKAATTSLGLTLISTVTASNQASVTFTSGIGSTYDEYELHIINAVPQTNGAIPWVRTSTNAGSSYDSTSGDYFWTLGVTVGTTVTATNGSTTATAVILASSAGTSNTASAGGFNAVVKIYDPAGTSVNKVITWDGSNSGTSTATTFERVSGAGRRVATADVDAIQFLFSSGNVVSGKFKLYGVRKS